MALDFPASPVNGQVFLASSGTTYIFNAATNAWLTAGQPGGVYVGDSPPPATYDGQLWFHSLLGTLLIRYNDSTSVQWVPCNPAPTPSGIARLKFTPFAANGTWTPDPKMLFGWIYASGGGQGGNSGGGGASGYVVAGQGGLSGMRVTKFFNAGLAASYAVTIGAGGAGTGGGGNAGGDTSVGTLCVAPGGNSATAYVGDMRDWSNSTGQLFSLLVSGTIYSGPGAGWGGGAMNAAGSGSGWTGVAGAANTGGGGGGGGVNNTPGNGFGGSGGSGFCYITEFLSG